MVKISIFLKIVNLKDFKSESKIRNEVTTPIKSPIITKSLISKKKARIVRAKIVPPKPKILLSPKARQKMSPINIICSVVKAKLKVEFFLKAESLAEDSVLS